MCCYNCYSVERGILKKITKGWMTLGIHFYNNLKQTAKGGLFTRIERVCG